ncbi:hypothetical protein C4K88_11630 [Arthrobacter pityocampae]|uniref:Uncharacterized protein n=1 Tax=Arthrobacter pityocampae TaxID=547334 RepID=A0A2S5IV31_9MICC|nr:hypothetical protein [Arthrobacter pityocampae]PPB48401.1 hypothetical protein C4K88_11630 [Arthrobacter pityocampae]
MTIDIDLDKVHALALAPVQSPLRERQILMVQQALHNAHIPTPEDRHHLLSTCAGRPVTSIRDLHQGDLGPVLAHLRKRTREQTP